MVDPLVARLRAAGCVYAEDEARLLRGAAPGAAALEALVRRRVAGVPLEVLVGWAELDGVRVRTAPGVFVPRSRSLLLVRLAQAHLQRRPAPTVVDLCCGTGALGLLLARRLPDAQVHAADVDPAAVACARANLGPHRVHEGDLYDALPPALHGRTDALLVNAPYVPTSAIVSMPPEARDHEPRVALDGGTDGLDLHRRVAAGAPAWLAPGGVLLLETSSGQAQRTRSIVEQAGLDAVVEHDAELGGTVVRGARRP